MKNDIGFISFIKSHTLLVAAILSLFSVFGFAYSLKTSDLTIINNSIWSVVLFSIFTFITFKAIRVCNKRKLVIGVITAAILSITLVFGKSLILADRVIFWPFFSLVKLIIGIISLIFLFTALLVIVLHYLPKVQEFLFGLRIERTNSKLFKPNLKFF